jgi:dihydrofolate reductase
VLTNPNPDPNELKFAQLAEKSRHIVFTKGDFKPDWKNTKVAHDLPAEVARLKKEDGKNIIAWGGAAFAVSLIDLGLVDEYRLGINPTILTKGKALFANLKQRKKLVLISSKTVESDMIIARYRSSGPAKLGN